MLKYHPSLRRKITFGYYAIVGIISVFSLFTFMELRYVEKKIMFGDVISEFFDATLEIRRFEKNYFLYKERSDLYENAWFAVKAQDLLERNIQGFGTLAQEPQVQSLRTSLKRYMELMEQYSGWDRTEDAGRRTALENSIRETGKQIVTSAEEISKRERRELQAILNNSQNIVIVSIIFLALFVLALGQVLSRMVVRPLKSLENSMNMIADGNYERMSLESRDREIASLANAFNKMLKELELRQRHLVQSEKLASLGTLLSGVAHELNNPLSNISSSCQILMEEIEDADTEFKKELLAQIEEQTDKARNIVRSLLEFSRDREFKKETLLLRKLFEETIRFVRGQVPTNLNIAIDVPDDILIFADKQRMQQAFLNLIRNAIESISDEGEVFIRAKKHKATDKVEDTETEIFNYLKYHGKCTLEDDTVDIEIRDTGSGIPKDVLPKIFDPFFTTKDVGKGSGLGLFIVHEIIEEHDGCIAVDSEAGKGTTFLIRLPLKEK
ncbi:MAG: ATP-binding protein [Nitrospirota bacterium]